MAPYEALFGRRCRSPIGWFDVGENQLVGQYLIQQAVNKVKRCPARKLLLPRRAKERQKRPLAILGKLYREGPSETSHTSPLEPTPVPQSEWARVPGYKALSTNQSQARPQDERLPDEGWYRYGSAYEVYGWFFFYSTPFRESFPDTGSTRDPSRVLPVDDIQVTKQLSYKEVPVPILDRQVRRLRTKDIVFVNVLLRNKNVEEVTWQAEEVMKIKYPTIVSSSIGGSV
ncbi:uncharacterized protein LOC132628522 [Lycium barbarum]|uniref:uncharacterized protein LOC132628522 n=1 Tax=Lycium barbarum TaxID=112863 RepID=UPI00293EEAE3|nr:uncharacterized protein LOC132628522 [Lycium barbarum]